MRKQLEALKPAAPGTLNHERFVQKMAAYYQALLWAGHSDLDARRMAGEICVLQEQKFAALKRPDLRIITPRQKRQWARDAEAFQQERADGREELELGKEAASRAREIRKAVAVQGALLRTRARLKKADAREARLKMFAARREGEKRRLGTKAALIALSQVRLPSVVLREGMRGVLGMQGAEPLPKRLDPFDLLDASSLVNEDFGDGMDEEGSDDDWD